MSTIIKRVAALAFASAVIAGVLPAGALAQQATTPPSVSMLTQISGLTVNSVEGIAHVLGGSDAVPVMYSGVEAVVTATRPWSCPPVNGQPVACAAVMPEPTPIHVMTRTSVLDRNR